MLADPSRKYPRADVLSLAERNWPANTLSQAPRWCSTDLRDGNQALVNPMNREQKMRLFERLVQCGFKEIEVAFPAASNTDFTFVRELIEQKHVPEDVWIQVITQSRPDLIERTLAALQGAPRAIVHLYNATAPLFRELVFRQDKAATIALAVRGVTQIRDHCDTHSHTDWVLEYSPETFCFTEPEFALAICTEVIETWQPSDARPLILNLPATVEVNTPNVYADQIEWFVSRLPVTEHVTISVHPHNDRGTGVACAELAMLAGATRVEGCLFGNGERTGNVDLVTLALNLYTQGISPGLDFSGLRELVALVEECNGLPVHPRHPYAGELVFTAFSGSHQDAIRKGFAEQARHPDAPWRIPYLPLDPADVGCDYQAVIRVNSQSGKSGAAWLLEQNHGLQLPRRLQQHFSRRVQEATDITGKELPVAEIWALFRQEYGLTEPARLTLVDYASESGDNGLTLRAKINTNGEHISLQGHGNGLLSAMMDAINHHYGLSLDIVDYHEHTLGQASRSKAVAYLECRHGELSRHGVGIDTDSARAGLQAVINITGAALADQFPR
ncbi:2-isopropylmalate synthase [Oceanimonas baumannii]|uniref:2-isopropylmalate synthase n=1 Tax=Oceanimonas baumannii TaxID=129578 RepID=A0A235CFJ7_9GAMM|nr:2-isopropylmalate synthase [Oceanimonas baumannii]OYD22797.1 2-isopropylmalate synthase [Oceanimonas baumannii]TDW57763.1 2-isopropylmalate synthase [Oceanimonas baumannii]